MTRIHLITRGDDIGTNISANQAAQEAYQQGILRNASLMVPCAGIREAAAMLAGEKGLCFGLHVTLNAEWDTVKWGPVLPPEKVPSLVNENGHFFQTTQQLHEHQPKLGEIMAEMQAQLDLARELGFEIKYADTHMGFLWVVKELAVEFDRWCQRNGILRPQGHYPMLPMVEAKGDPVEKLIARMEAAEPGVYLIVGHPAYNNEEMRPLGHPGYESPRVAREREWERLIFMDPRIVEYCTENGVVPVRFDEV